MSFKTTPPVKQPPCPYRRHGGSRTPAHNSWRGMKDRCSNPRHHQFPDYGGRGISVCSRWAESFVAFLEDMGPQPPGFTLERKDNDGNYEPKNCIWASRQAQGRNKSNNRLLSLHGRTQPLAAWAEETGLKRSTIVMRLDRYGWTVERALLTPPFGSPLPKRLLTHDGRTLSLRDWAREVGASPSAFAARLKRMSLSKALTYSPRKSPSSNSPRAIRNRARLGRIKESLGV